MAIDYERYRINGVSHLYGLTCLAAQCLGKALTGEIGAKIRPLFEDLRSDMSKTEFSSIIQTNDDIKHKIKGTAAKKSSILNDYCGIT